MKSLLHKLILSSLIIILLPMGLAILWTSKTFTTILERRFAEKSRAHAEQAQLLLRERQEIATGLVHWISEMPGVKERLKRKDRPGLFQLLLPLVGSVEMDFIEILDQEGRVFLRVHDPSHYGDRPALAKDIQGLLKGMRDLPNYGVEERAGRAYLRAVESIEGSTLRLTSKGEAILGAVSAGYTLNPDFIKKLEQAADGTVVLSVGQRLYSASGSGATAAAENTAGQEVRWHREGLSPALEIRLPLETLRGAEGVISITFPAHEMAAAIGTLKKTLFLVALMGTFLALSISWILSRRLTRPLKELVRGTEQVAAGNYAVTVRIDSNDEIGILAASFNRMLEELSRSKAEVESYRQELERKFAERSKELVETEKKRAAMAHMIAHDLKNPLLGIKKTLERLEYSAPEKNGEERKRILKDLLSAGDLVIGMVNEMLDLYRSDFGDLPLSLTVFPLEESVQAALRILGPELEEKRLQVVNRSDPPHIPILADKRRLTRLLINLLSNAIKFSPENGRIFISAALAEDNGKAGARVQLCVEDEGMGIPQEDFPKIFDRFYSRDQGRVETGTGLGLPYCRLVAEAHRGKIWAENRSGGGLVVSVVLPTGAASRQEIYGT